MKLGGPVKEKCLCITVALGPFESKVLYLHIATAVRDLFESKVLYTLQLQKGPKQVPRLPSLKLIIVYNPDNDRIWEYETGWTHSASSDMHTFSPDVRM